MAARQLQDNNKGAGLGITPVVYRLSVLTDQVGCDVNKHVIAALRHGTVLMNELAALCHHKLHRKFGSDAARWFGYTAEDSEYLSRAMPVGVNNLHVYPSLR